MRSSIALPVGKLLGCVRKTWPDILQQSSQMQRKAKGISQEILAEKADCDSTMRISLIERKIRNPTLNLADSLAQGLGVPLSQMIKEAEDLRAKDRPAKSGGREGKAVFAHRLTSRINIYNFRGCHLTGSK